MTSLVMAIRDAAITDIDDLTCLMCQLGYLTSVQEMKQRFDLIKDHPDYKTIIGIANDEIVGMIGLNKGLYYEKNGLYLRILALIVKPEYRRQGMAKFLIKASEDWALEKGLQAVYVNCGNRPERKSAHKFYESMGYTSKSIGFVKQIN